MDSLQFETIDPKDRLINDSFQESVGGPIEESFTISKDMAALSGLPEGAFTESKTFRFRPVQDIKSTSGNLLLQLKNRVVTIARSKDHNNKPVCFRTIAFEQCQVGWATNPGSLFTADQENAQGGVLDRWEITKLITGCPRGCWSKFFRSDFTPDIYDATVSITLIVHANTWTKCRR